MDRVLVLALVLQCTALVCLAAPRTPQAAPRAPQAAARAPQAAPPGPAPARSALVSPALYLSSLATHDVNDLPLLPSQLSPIETHLSISTIDSPDAALSELKLNPRIQHSFPVGYKVKTRDPVRRPIFEKPHETWPNIKDKNLVEIVPIRPTPNLATLSSLAYILPKKQPGHAAREEIVIIDSSGDGGYSEEVVSSESWSDESSDEEFDPEHIIINSEDHDVYHPHHKNKHSVAKHRKIIKLDDGFDLNGDVLDIINYYKKLNRKRILNKKQRLDKGYAVVKERNKYIKHKKHSNHLPTHRVKVKKNHFPLENILNNYWRHRGVKHEIFYNREHAHNGEDEDQSVMVENDSQEVHTTHNLGTDTDDTKLDDLGLSDGVNNRQDKEILTVSPPVVESNVKYTAFNHDVNESHGNDDKVPHHTIKTIQNNHHHTHSINRKSPEETIKTQIHNDNKHLFDVILNKKDTTDETNDVTKNLPIQNLHNNNARKDKEESIESVLVLKGIHKNLVDEDSQNLKNHAHEHHYHKIITSISEQDVLPEDSDESEKEVSALDSPDEPHHVNEIASVQNTAESGRILDDNRESEINNNDNSLAHDISDIGDSKEKILDLLSDYYKHHPSLLYTDTSSDSLENTASNEFTIISKHYNSENISRESNSNDASHKSVSYVVNDVSGKSDDSENYSMDGEFVQSFKVEDDVDGSEHKNAILDNESSSASTSSSELKIKKAAVDSRDDSSESQYDSNSDVDVSGINNKDSDIDKLNDKSLSHNGGSAESASSYISNDELHVTSENRNSELSNGANDVTSNEHSDIDDQKTSNHSDIRQLSSNADSETDQKQDDYKAFQKFQKTYNLDVSSALDTGDVLHSNAPTMIRQGKQQKNEEYENTKETTSLQHKREESEVETNEDLDTQPNTKLFLSSKGQGLKQVEASRNVKLITDCLPKTGEAKSECGECACAEDRKSYHLTFLFN